MTIERKIHINEFILACMAIGYVVLGMYLAYQNGEIEHIKLLLSMTLAQLSEVRITRL